MSTSEQHTKDLNKAFNLSLISLIGFFIPIIGIIIAIVSLSLSSGVPVNSDTKGKKKATKLMATLAIVLGILAAYGYYTAYNNQQNQIKVQEQKAKDEKAQADLDKILKESGLSSCLQQADASYNSYVELNSTNTTTGSDGQKVYYMPQYKWDYANSTRTSSKDECYRRYPQ